MAETNKVTMKNSEPEKGKGGVDIPHKCTQVQVPPKTEHTGLCTIQEAFLYYKPCAAAGVCPGQVDFIYDSGTVSCVIGEKEMHILKTWLRKMFLLRRLWANDLSLSYMGIPFFVRNVY